MSIIFDWDKKYNKGIIKSDLLDVIREHFSVKNKTAYITKHYSGFAPSRKYAITNAGRFDLGLFKDICKKLVELQLPFSATDDFKKEYFIPYEFYKDDLPKLSLELRDYQITATNAALKQGTGNIVISMAGGKTLIIATLIQSIRNNTNKNLTLIIVPSIQLVEQTYKDFIDYGLDSTNITRWSGKHKKDPKAEIIIASSSILQSKLSDRSFFKDLDLLIVDEAHKCRKGNKINKLIDQIPTPHKFGFTGTMPPDKIDYWNVVGKLGPVVYEKTSKELRDEKYISDGIIEVIKLEYNNMPIHTEVPSILKPTVAYDTECDFLYENQFRNNIINNLCDRLDKNTLIIVDRIIHGEAIYNTIKELHKKKVYFIQGSVSLEAREEIRTLMEDRDDIICIAISKIFSTGINIKNLHYIIFGDAGKAKIKIIQSIGRGLGLHETKNKLVIFDIADNLTYGKRHLEERINLYDQEKYKYKITTLNEKNYTN